MFQYINVITLYQFPNQDIPLQKDYVGGGGHFGALTGISNFLQRAAGHTTHSTKLGLHSPSNAIILSTTPIKSQKKKYVKTIFMMILLIKDSILQTNLLLGNLIYIILSPM